MFDIPIYVLRPFRYKDKLLQRGVHHLLLDIPDVSKVMFSFFPYRYFIAYLGIMFNYDYPDTIDNFPKVRGAIYNQYIKHKKKYRDNINPYYFELNSYFYDGCTFIKVN